MPPKTLMADAEDATKLRKLCDAQGVESVAKQLEISRDSLWRVLAGYPVTRGTALLLKQALAKLAP